MTAARWDIRLSRSLLVVVSLAMGSSTSVAEDIPREQHAWGRFAPGSWTRIRVTLETIGENGQKILRSELVTTRLQKVDQHGVTLQRETVGVGKNDVPIKHKPVVLNWDGTRRDGLRTERLSLGEIKILGRSHTCQTHTVTRAIGDTRITTKSWYSPDTAPFFLKQLVRVRGLKPRHTARDVTRTQGHSENRREELPGMGSSHSGRRLRRTGTNARIPQSPGSRRPRARPGRTPRSRQCSDRHNDPSPRRLPRRPCRLIPPHSFFMIPSRA